MPTQVQLHLSVMTLSLGKIFRFLNSLDVGYLSSSIGPQPGKGSAAKSNAARYAYGSKDSANHHTKKESISDHDSSKGLVPSGYGYSVTEVEGSIPLEKMQNVSVQEQQPTRGDSLSETMPDTENVIRVTTRFEVTHE